MSHKLQLRAGHGHERFLKYRQASGDSGNQSIEKESQRGCAVTIQYNSTSAPSPSFLLHFWLLGELMRHAGTSALAQLLE